MYTYLFAICAANQWPCSFPKVSDGNLYQTEKECKQALVSTQAQNTINMKYFGKGSAVFYLYSPCMPLGDAMGVVAEQATRQ
ncbi:MULTISPECIES: hypothetical protein [unclassified Pseudomonas]|uniref:hypothetical protein n=1 Tax=unclassified Pseudomonas TaxID=196821 RepID=UPI0024486047|nr:hypothetical protein [Pseudomonas sp. GD03696]MDH1927765.1 hypothetical protein [Pseudomonas sp. GD03696]